MASTVLVPMYFSAAKQIINYAMHNCTSFKISFAFCPESAGSSIM